MRVLLAHALTPKRRRIARVLSEAGHEVVEVDDPQETIERCRAWAPDVALLHIECCGDAVLAIKSDPVAYGMAAMDVHGRLSDRSVLDALGWAPGTAIGMDVEDGPGGPAAVAVTGGSGRITVAGQLRLPARLRNRLGLRAGDRVLLAGHPAVARLVCYPPATLDAVLAAVATSASGDPE